MKKTLTILGIGIFWLLCEYNVFAYWEGPYEVLRGSWGTDVGQFGYVHGDPTDGFPRNFLVDNLNNIIIADSINKRVQIFRVDGGITQFSYKDLNLKWRIIEWPSNSIGVYDHVFVEGGFGKFQYYDYQGNLIRQFSITDLIFKKLEADGSLILQNYKTDKYFKYSPTGHLLETYTEPPLELGVVDEMRLGDGRYKVTVKYPGKEWVITGKGACEKYIKIGDCELYCIGQMQIVKYDEEGNERSRLTIPENNIQQIPTPGEGIEPHINVLEEYGPPVVSPIGDVYTWKRTPNTYSIIKWVWVDGPDSPRFLKGSSSTDSITLTWEVPDEAADEVKEYEITRSKDVCGPYNVIGKVKKDIHTYVDKEVKKGEAYYYQVRAVKEEGYSGYSNKAVGSIVK